MVRETYRPQPDGITKEEFGLNLYEAIKCIGGMLGLDQQRAGGIHYGRPYDALAPRRAKLVHDWTHHRAILTHDELTQILAHYPWVRDL
jgi:hypothetical protein